MHSKIKFYLTLFADASHWPSPPQSGFDTLVGTEGAFISLELFFRWDQRQPRGKPERHVRVVGVELRGEIQVSQSALEFRAEVVMLREVYAGWTECFALLGA